MQRKRHIEHNKCLETPSVTDVKATVKENDYYKCLLCLKVQSCELCNSKYKIGSTQLLNTEIFTFIAPLVFKSCSSRCLFLNRKRQ